MNDAFPTAEDEEAIAILSTEFGRDRGWIVSQDPFGLEQLSARSDTVAEHGILDRSPDGVFYRLPSPPHRPAAIALHLRLWPALQPGLQPIAEGVLGLRIEQIWDFPGWRDGVPFVLITSLRG